MKPIKFPEANVTFAKDQPEYQQLPALRYDTQHGEVVSCWRLSWKERLRVLFGGKVWLSLMMFGKPFTPSYLTTVKKEVVNFPDENSKGL
jgi:hypothetical protein